MILADVEKVIFTIIKFIKEMLEVKK